MSKLDELIAELCPDGVEYKPLSEIATITRGGNLQKKDFTESGVPCIHYGQIYTKYGLFTEKTFTFVSGATALRQKKAGPSPVRILKMYVNAWFGLAKRMLPLVDIQLSFITTRMRNTWPTIFIHPCSLLRRLNWPTEQRSLK